MYMRCTRAAFAGEFNTITIYKRYRVSNICAILNIMFSVFFLYK